MVKDSLSPAMMYNFKNGPFPKTYLIYAHGILKFRMLMKVGIDPDSKDYILYFDDGTRINYVDEDVRLYDLDEVKSFLKRNLIFDIQVLE